MSTANKMFSILVCSLLSTTIFFTPIECARKTNTRQGSKSQSGTTSSSNAVTTLKPNLQSDSSYSNYNPAPPPYSPNANAAPQYGAGGYQQNTYQGGSFQQPGYQAPAQSSFGSGLQTAAIAGIGGLALYAALKPGETNTVYINNGTNETPGVLPEKLVVPGLDSVYDPVSNTTVNCTALVLSEYERSTMTTNVNNESSTVTTTAVTTSSTTEIPTVSSTQTSTPITTSSTESTSTINSTEIQPVINAPEPDVMVDSTRMLNESENIDESNPITPTTTTTTTLTPKTESTIQPIGVPQVCKDQIKTFLIQYQTSMNSENNGAKTSSNQQTPAVSAVMSNSEQTTENTELKHVSGFGNKLDVTVISILVPFLITLILKV